MADLRAPLHRLSSVLDRLAVTSNAPQVASERVLQSNKALVAHVEASIRHFQATVTDVISKINEHVASSTDGSRMLCYDREKVLDAQTDELTVSVGQLTVCVKASEAALAPRHRAGVMRALLAATGVQELCKVDLKPRVSAKLDIATDVIGVIRGLKNMTILRLYDVDRSKSIASGAGLVSCVRGMGAVNEVYVACVNSAGKPTDWVALEDVDVFVRSIDGVLIGRRTGRQMIGKGEIVIKFEVDDVDVDEVELSVVVGGVIVSGGPQRVPLCGAIKTDAAHIRTIPINGECPHGVAVTLDGLHLVVSNFFSDSISVYSMDTGDCITTFGSLGSGTGQFNNPSRICATPRGTILVSDSGNKRLQEVTITGEHIRCIGESHLDSDGVLGMSMQGDIVAVGKHVGSTDGRILLFSYSSGALIRKFGSYGSGEGQIEIVYGISFTSDGRHILVVDFYPRLSMFTVDGLYVKTLGTDVLCRNCKDVLCSGSNIFIADCSNHRICVFSAETGALIRTWGTEGRADGQFHYSSALSAHKGKLFVLDLSCRVQVFQ
jgi:DNA-binding beta-propeller fold protein YncE